MQNSLLHCCSRAITCSHNQSAKFRCLTIQRYEYWMAIIAEALAECIASDRKILQFAFKIKNRNGCSRSLTGDRTKSEILCCFTPSRTLGVSRYTKSLAFGKHLVLRLLPYSNVWDFWSTAQGHDLSFTWISSWTLNRTHCRTLLFTNCW